MHSILILIKILVWSATFSVMLGGALRLGPEALRVVRERPALFVRTLAAVWIAVPLLTILVVLALNVRGLGGKTLLLMSFCPGVPLLLASTRKVRGATTTAFVALVLTAVTEPLLIPYGTRIVSSIASVDLTVQPRNILAVLVPTVFLPVVVGFAIRAMSLRAATALARVSDVVFAVGIVVGVIVVLIQAVPLLLHVPARTFVATVIITLGDALIGFWVGRPNEEDQKAIALATALGNPALALAVVEVSFPGFDAFALIALYILLRGIALAPFEWWLKRWGNGTASALGRMFR